MAAQTFPQFRPGRLRSSYLMAKASLELLRSNKLLLTPTLASLLLVISLVLSTTFLTVATARYWAPSLATINPVELSGIKILGTLLELYVVTIIVNFSAVIITALALDRFQGGTLTLRQATQVAIAKVSSILRFSAVSATVGLVVNLLVERLPVAGRLVAWLGGLAWNIATIFAIPVITLEDGNISAGMTIKKSSKIVTATWGENLILNAGIGLIAVFTLIVSIFIGGVLIFGSIAIGSKILVFGVAGLVLVGIILALLIYMTLVPIATAAVYYYATTGESPVQFEKRVLQAALTPRKSRRIFGA
jgi:hypothetical protein